jgi:uncharacterized protein GlcG (DUF336 family)
MSTPRFESLEDRRYFNPDPIQPLNQKVQLTAPDVSQIVEQAAAVSLPSQTIVVVDRDGNILAAFGQQPGLNPDGTPASTVNAADLSGAIHPTNAAGTTFDGALVENTDSKYALIEAVRRARTVAFFESREDAFSTRTARYIINDHFPEPIDNTEAGPLLGVEFSSEFGTDGLRPGQGTGLANGLSGDPGGIPLFKLNANGKPVPVGGIGVAGDGHDEFPRYDLQAPADPNSPRARSNPNNVVWNGTEESDFDEAVAVAGSQGFFAPQSIQSTDILVNGLRFPFVENGAATGPAVATPDHPGLGDLADLPARVFIRYDEFNSLPVGTIATQNGVVVQDYSAFIPIDSPKQPYPQANILLNDGTVLQGQLKNNNPDAGGGGLPTADNPLQLNHSFIPTATPGVFTVGNYGYIDSPSLTLDNMATTLTHFDVDQVIRDAASEANSIRAAIRLPSGVPVKVHIAVTDLQGNILGVYKMFDGTNFSFDIAIQKARTAAFFSDNTAAFSSRGVGFMADGQFPPAIENGISGPLYQLQEDLSLPGNLGNFMPTLANGQHNPLANGITIFPGGAPLYKNGVLVGAVGVSGDGVDQDDLISFAGTTHYRAPDNIQADHLDDPQLVPYLENKVNTINEDFGFLTIAVRQDQFGIIDPEVASEAGNRSGIETSPNDTIIDRVLRRLAAKGLQSVRIPFQKFPRNPEL